MCCGVRDTNERCRLPVSALSICPGPHSHDVNCLSCSVSHQALLPRCCGDWKLPEACRKNKVIPTLVVLGASAQLFYLYRSRAPIFGCHSKTHQIKNAPSGIEPITLKNKQPSSKGRIVYSVYVTWRHVLHVQFKSCWFPSALYNAGHSNYRWWHCLFWLQ